ncbi:MaoC family dehydratase [Actinomadura chokoriensis]|uniref:MaoC family dehydratase n=1 Tax=Actinomadura chokoriensis TaxID=454156 RepID=A0ABV4R5N7_9ACTN
MTVHETQIGCYYEDFAVGDVFEHPSSRTVGESEDTWFTLLKPDTAHRPGRQNHDNADFTGRSPTGKVIVNSGLTVALVLGLSDISQTALLNLGWTDVKLTHPVFVGDTIRAESLITDMRESASRPYAGIITTRTRGLNQDGDEVVSWTRTVMVHKRDAPGGKHPEDETGSGGRPGARLM